MSEVREDAGRRLWDLWQQGRRPDVADFLAGAGPLGTLDLVAVLRVDQRQRWLAGERLPAEHYLQAHPGVAADEEAALDLVYSEYLLRQEQGEEVSPEEYLRRFPQFADQLRLQLDFGQALADRDAPQHPGNAWAQAIDPRFPGAAAAPDDPIATKAGFPSPLSKGPQADGPRSPPAEEPRTLPRRAVAPSLPADLRQNIEDICNRFESAWMKGMRPRIEDYLTEAAAPQRPALLRELLPLDVGYRRSMGRRRRPASTWPGSPAWSRPGWPRPSPCRRPGSRPEAGTGSRGCGGRGRTASAVRTVTARSSCSTSDPRKCSAPAAAAASGCRRPTARPPLPPCAWASFSCWNGSAAAPSGQSARPRPGAGTHRRPEDPARRPHDFLARTSAFP